MDVRHNFATPAPEFCSTSTNIKEKVVDANKIMSDGTSIKNATF